MSDESCKQALAAYAGRMISVCGHLSDYGDRIQESQQVSTEQTQQADDPSGPGWRDVEPDEILQVGDMFWLIDHWELTQNDGGKSSLYGNGYRRRIEQQQQPSDSEPETIDSWEMRLAKMTQWNLELEALVAEAERSGQQVNAELQQLREQVTTVTRERDRYQAWLQQHHTTGQQSAVKKLERWLRPVLELVAEHPEDASPLAVAVLGYLPGIASRLIEE